MNIPIVDTHLHLWDIEKFYYPWLEGQDYLKRTFTINDYRQDTLGIDIEKMVFVECDVDRSLYLEEVDYISDIAEKQDRRICGIVCFAPLEKGEGVREELETLKKNPLVKGVRRIIQYEDDPDFCLQEDFIRGVRMLGEYGLSFDICIDYRHNKNIIQFLEKLKGETRCILDHLGKPGIKQGLYEPWATEIGVMAGFPNLYCKYSSLPSEADWERWTKDELRPYSDRALECFTFDRCIFGGDWPPVQRAASYKECVEMTLEFTQGATDLELQKLFHDNAVAFYGL